MKHALASETIFLFRIFFLSSNVSGKGVNLTWSEELTIIVGETLARHHDEEQARQDHQPHGEG